MSGSAPWHRHYHEDFLTGVKHLTPEQRGNYYTIVDLIYQYGGRIADRAIWIAGQCNTTVRAWNRCRRFLIEQGKLVAVDGYLRNPRCDREIAARISTGEEKREAGRAGGIKSGQTRNKQKKPLNAGRKPKETNGLGNGSASSASLHVRSSPNDHELAEKLPENLPVREATTVISQSVGRSRDSESQKEVRKEGSKEVRKEGRKVPNPSGLAPASPRVVAPQAQAIEVWNEIAQGTPLVTELAPTKAMYAAVTRAIAHPAIGQDLEKWRAYCRWLSKRDCFGGLSDNPPADLMQATSHRTVSRWADTTSMRPRGLEPLQPAGESWIVDGFDPLSDPLCLAIDQLEQAMAGRA